MSWMSSTFAKAVDAPANDSPLARYLGSDAKKWLRRGTASALGGPMGFQFQYSREKGMNDGEASENAVGGGMTYSQARGAQEARGMEEDARAAARQLQMDERRERLAAQFKMRRSRAERVSTKSGTLVTGPSGTPGSTTGGGAGAVLLGG